jgi:SAM-dependent methyltransferase
VTAPATDAARAANAAIAALYDEVPYATQPWPPLDPARLMALSRMYGCAGTIGDVLDLGCGCGAELDRLGAFTPGALAGVDLSAVSVAAARTLCAPLGPRARIWQADILDLDPRTLGQFDLILCVGVIYVAPLEVRQKALELIGRCLRPGGLAVVTYHAGAVPALRRSLHRGLRAVALPGATRQQAIDRARAQLASIASVLSRKAGEQQLMCEALDRTAGSDDVVLYHEVFNPDFDAPPTTEIEAALAAQGLSFLTYVGEPSVGIGPTSAIRAFTADAVDLRLGGYRTAVFARGPSPAGPSLREPSLIWRSSLRRHGEPDYAAPFGRFEILTKRLEIEVGSRLAQAFVDSLIAAPRGWDAALADAVLRLGPDARPVDDDEIAALDVDLVVLWGRAAVEPVVAIDKLLGR